MKTVMLLLFLEVIQMLGCLPQKQKFMALTAPEAQNTKYHKTPCSISESLDHIDEEAEIDDDSSNFDSFQNWLTQIRS